MRKPTLVVLASICALATLGQGAARAAAVAAPSHELSLVVAGFVEEPGHRPVPPPEGEYEDACGVAIDPAGEILISDYYHRVIYDYSPGGTYLGEQTQMPGPDGPCNLATDAAGDLYVNHWRSDVVRYRPTGGGEYGEASVLDSRGSTGVAVDPASGRIYVDDRTFVAVYEEDGAPVLVAGLPLEIGTAGLRSGYGVAVSDFPGTEGDVYVPDAGAGLVRVYGPAGEELAPITGLGTPQRGFVSLADSNVAVDPSDGHVYVVDDIEPGFEHPLAAVEEFNPAGEYRGRLPGRILDGEPSGLTISGGRIYVTSGNDENAVLLAFGPTFPAHRMAVAITGAGQGRVTSEPAGIDCPGACAAEYDVGEELFLTAVPEPGSTFVGWSGAGCGAAILCHLLLGADTEAQAEFAPAPTAAVARTEAAGIAPPAAGTGAPIPQAVALPPSLGVRSLAGAGRLRVLVPTAGTLSVSGRGLRGVRTPATAGPRLLTVSLDAAGRRALREGKAGRLRARATVLFTAADGSGSVRGQSVLAFSRGRGR
ncbi:MAG TPA: hypothetical protein VHZ54_10510 [Solirubrobacterales bacterium]|nr:hypothetical protein [Solirubrobacterales bacterium]